MATCKNCFRKYDSKGIQDGLFSSYPNFEFCSSVCASAKREANEEQRTRESAERSDAEYQRKYYESQQRDQSYKMDELIRLQKEANIILKEESEARSLGISRTELIARREKQQRDIKIATEISKRVEEEKQAKSQGITRDELLARRKEKDKQYYTDQRAEEKRVSSLKQTKLLFGGGFFILLLVLVNNSAILIVGLIIIIPITFLSFINNLPD